MPLFTLGDGGNIGYTSFPYSVDQETPVPSRTDPASPNPFHPIPAHFFILKYRTKYAPVLSQPVPAPLLFNGTGRYRTVRDFYIVEK